jgi:hypothetical protein
MPRSRQPEAPFLVKLTQAQRKVVAEIAPELAKRLKLDDRGQRAIPLTLAELRMVKEKVRSALRHAGTGRGRIPLRHVFQACGQALDPHLGTCPSSVTPWRMPVATTRRSCATAESQGGIREAAGALTSFLTSGKTVSEASDPNARKR